MQEKIFSTEWLGRTLTLKTGKLAKQANSAVTAQYGDTVVMATVVETEEEREGIDFFPLMVEFEERLYAAGIIKGSQWIKREGRPSDEAVLTGRMIDRSIRPLFGDDARKEVQVVITVLSVDQENDYTIVGLIAASAALAISSIAWAGPIGGIRVGKVDGQFIFNPSWEQEKISDLDLMVAGTDKKVIMIEAGASEVKEDDMFKAIMGGLEKMQPAITLIKEMQAEVKKEGKPAQAKKLLTNEEIESEKKINEIKEKASKWLEENTKKILFDKVYYTKGERKAAVKAIKHGLDNFLFENGIDKDDRKKIIGPLVDKQVDKEITNALINDKKRVDGRKLNEIRQLSSEAGMLPRTHGSSLFSRGETQIMSIVTLGASGLEQTIEGMEGTSQKRYMHHYNFPPFSVGEVKPMRGPGRREIGHGALAEKALEPVIPTKEDFPYTIRVVSETLGSNGSSSMGSTCASSLALMDAGVPIKKPVAGIAMGLASNEDMSKWEVLTDIQDLEDGKGGMDFKITGTTDGITAIQLDTKTNGLTKEIIEKALSQGREARLEILKNITKAIDKPRADLSPYAPRIVSFRIDPAKIKDVIGSGGKVINKIIEETGVSIDIEDDGLVMICGIDAEKSKEAVEKINNIVRKFEAGEIFAGRVVRLMDFGAFVELVPGRDGMVHVSELAPYRVDKPDNFVKLGDIVQVKIKEIDDQGRVNLTMQGLPENEILWKDEKGKSLGSGGFAGAPRPRFNNDSRRGGSSRGGGDRRGGFGRR